MAPPLSGRFPMGFQGFEGSAGTGKTHRLIESVTDSCQKNGLKEHQRLLALTFMHGSRRRLDDRLRGVSSLKGRFAAQTIDGFATSLCRRWRVLAAHHGIAFGESFGQTCDACALLLEFRHVALWVARTFPVVVVDEAQELSASSPQDCASTRSARSPLCGRRRISVS